MSEPSREHVEAVARVIAGVSDYSLDAAEDILTSTHPAVLDAMQDALVRAGRLTEEPAWRELPDESWKVRRFVTEWTDA